jgi:hypothetical protein
MRLLIRKRDSINEKISFKTKYLFLFADVFTFTERKKNPLNKQVVNDNNYNS